MSEGQMNQGEKKRRGALPLEDAVERYLRESGSKLVLRRFNRMSRGSAEARTTDVSGRYGGYWTLVAEVETDESMSDAEVDDALYDEFVLTIDLWIKKTGEEAT